MPGSLRSTRTLLLFSSLVRDLRHPLVLPADFLPGVAGYRPTLLRRFFSPGLGGFSSLLSMVCRVPCCRFHPGPRVNSRIGRFRLGLLPSAYGNAGSTLGESSFSRPQMRSHCCLRPGMTRNPPPSPPRRSCRRLRRFCFPSPPLPTTGALTSNPAVVPCRTCHLHGHTSLREPLDSYGSRCSAVSMTELPVGEECWLLGA